MVGHERIKVQAEEDSHGMTGEVKVCQKGSLKMAFIVSNIYVAKAGGARSKGDAKDDVGIRSKRWIVDLMLTIPA